MENEDWTQAAILSRKISTKYFARKPKKTPEQLEKEQKQREEKAKKDGTEVEEAPKEDDVTDLKLRFYEQQVRLAKHEDKYLEACKHYRQVLDTEAIEEDPERLKMVRLAPLEKRTSLLTKRTDSSTSHLFCYSCTP